MEWCESAGGPNNLANRWRSQDGIALCARIGRKKLGVQAASYVVSMGPQHIPLELRRSRISDELSERIARFYRQLR